ncbi:hypothetical protein DL96DRAFT_237203 [Flagelloscypha sp. PMI_526]|nr:hypothetical protein DL96DRAFT_237203 [Flagelloscypha sp. PMI_526]
MGRAEFNQGSINIAYGRDHITGYFLTITDRRLSADLQASAEVKSIAEKVEKQQKFGGYFDLHTGFSGFGFQVGIETLSYFWKKYDIPEEDIARAKRGENVPAPKVPFKMPPENADKASTRLDATPKTNDPKSLCMACGKSTTQKCSRCGAFWACSPEHAKVVCTKVSYSHIITPI